MKKRYVLKAYTDETVHAAAARAAAAEGLSVSGWLERVVGDAAGDVLARMRTALGLSRFASVPEIAAAVEPHLSGLTDIEQHACRERLSDAAQVVSFAAARAANKRRNAGGKPAPAPSGKPLPTSGATPAPSPGTAPPKQRATAPQTRSKGTPRALLTPAEYRAYQVRRAHRLGRPAPTPYAEEQPVTVRLDDPDLLPSQRVVAQ